MTRLSLLVVLFCAVGLAVAADDPEVFLYSKNGPEFKWVWAIKQSRMSALPKWDELSSDAPVSPHQALLAGRDFLRTRFNINTPNIVSITLSNWDHGIWAYNIFFDAKTPAEDDEPLLQVLVLMDGKVVVPVKQPVK